MGSSLTFERQARQLAQRIRTEWELGRMLPDAVRQGQYGRKSDGTTFMLNELGLSRDQSADFQRLAQVERADLTEASTVPGSK